jgi:hypothetical protein
MSSVDSMAEPAMLSPYARGDLARRVIADWRALPWRRSVRDSVYAERKKYLIRNRPPYGTFKDEMEPSREELER